MVKQIFIDAQFLQTGAYERGMGRYFDGLFSAMVRQLPDTVFHLMFSSPLDDANIHTLHSGLGELGGGVKLARLNLQTHDFGKDNYDEAYAHNKKVFTDYFKSMSSEDGAAAWLVPSLMQEPAVPAWPDSRDLVRAVIWHDLMPYLMYKHYFPDPGSPHARSYLKRLNQLLAAEHIYTNSVSTKNDLVEFLSVPRQRITVINGSFNRSLDLETRAPLPENIRQPFLLCPASPEPNKNITNTIQGFGEFNRRHHDRYQLVVTSDYDHKLAAEAGRHAKNVIFTGHISAEELSGLYRDCDALLFASKYEGFGLPIVEAVNFGKKIICSDIPVFREFQADEAFYWCDADEPASIAAAVAAAVKSGAQLSSAQRSRYTGIAAKYTWDNSAKELIRSLSEIKPRPAPARTIALVGPHPCSFSSIGKFLAETLPYLMEKSTVHYYYDSGPSDSRHGFVRFHYLQEYPHLYPVEQLLAAAPNYDKVIYHMGNSDHHMKTYLLAHAVPGTLILHDTDLGGKGLSGQMISQGYISSERQALETKIETGYLNQPERFISSLISSQPKVITHSTFAHEVARDYSLSDKRRILHSYHPAHILDLPGPLPSDSPIKLGIAGIMTEVKGVNTLQWLMSETDNLAGGELFIFGFGFFTDKSRLLQLAHDYPNVKVSFDLTDFEFKKMLSQLDVLINYRPVYKGEASRATLEAIMEGVVPLVRNIGWFSELPPEVCFKIDGIEELPGLVRSWTQHPRLTRQNLRPMAEAGHDLLVKDFGFDGYIKRLMED